MKKGQNKFKTIKRFIVVENTCGNFHGDYDTEKEAITKLKHLGNTRKFNEYSSSYDNFFGSSPDYVNYGSYESHESYSDYHIVDTFNQKIITVDVDITFTTTRRER